MVPYLVHYDTLLQYATVTLSQNATKVYFKMRQVFYYKMRQFYYKMRQLLQNATFITKCVGTINNRQNLRYYINIDSSQQRCREIFFKIFFFLSNVITTFIKIFQI